MNDDDNTNLTNADYYSDDVNAAALADNNVEPDNAGFDPADDQDTVSSQDMQIGDLDLDPEIQGKGENSYDEEAVPAGDNVTGQ